MSEITQNSILRISDKKTYQLIELYEKEECLWNTTIEEYKIRSLRNEAAERIAKILNLEHFTSRHVLMKFKNLRNSYCQELKKIASSIKAAEDPIYRPKVFWFSKMDSFLRPHLQSPREYKWFLNHEVIIKPEPEDEEEQTVFEINSHSEEDEDSKDYEPRVKRPRNSSNASMPIIDDVIPESALASVLQNISTHLQNMCNDNRDDCFDSFGKYVATMLRTMPTYKAMELQPKIVTLLVTGTMNGEGMISQSDDKKSL